MENDCSFGIVVTSEGRDEQVAGTLVEELTQIRGVGVRRATAGQVPAGAKSVDGGSLTELVISLSAAGAILPTLVTVIKDWLLRQPPKTILRLKEGNFDFQWTGTTPPRQIEEKLIQILALHGR